MPYPLKETAFKKLPVFIIASLMASMAGYINSAMLIEFALPVSQMTGVASRISDSISHGNFLQLGNSITILLAFLLGAFLSGLMIGRRQYRQNNAYGYGLLCIGGLLTTSSILSYEHLESSVLLAAIACGFQNALIASYRGLQIRTTHITGIITDIGVCLASYSKDRTTWDWQASLLVVLSVSFIAGGIFGVLAYQAFPNQAMILPAALMTSLGALYLIRSASAGKID